VQIYWKFQTEGISISQSLTDRVLTRKQRS